jgi:AcrR family transcriptional regulator
VSTAALYHYMGSKQDLLLEIIRGGLHELTAGAVEALGDVDEPVDRLDRLVRAHVTYHGRKQMVALVSDNELRSLDAPSLKSVIKIRDRYEALWAETIAAGVSEGDFRIDDQKLFRLGLMQMCTGVAYWYQAAGELSLPAIAEKFAVLALAMAGSPRAFDADATTPGGASA